MYSAMSVAGVMGYPAKTRQPAAMAPSVSAYVPASSSRRPVLARRAQSDHGATRVPADVASRVDIRKLLPSQPPTGSPSQNPLPLSRRPGRHHRARPNSGAPSVDITKLLPTRALAGSPSQGSSRDSAFRQSRLGLQ